MKQITMEEVQALGAPSVIGDGPDGPIYIWPTGEKVLFVPGGEPQLLEEGD